MDRSRDPRAGGRPSLRGRLLRWLRPPRTLRPTRAGWCFFLITFGVGFAALNTGNNLLYLVLSLMLAFLVLSGVLSEAALRGIRVRRQLPRDLFAGASASVGLEITNDQRRLPSFAVVVEDRRRGEGGEEVATGRVFVLRIAPGASESRFYRLTPPARGPLRLEGFHVFTRFPFGLFSKALRLEAPQEALVYPAIEPVPALDRFGSAYGGANQLSGPGGQGTEVSGLREFAHGDSVRRIHWRASLRRGELLARKVESEHQAEVEVRLRTRDAEPGEAFEQRVSWVASEVVAFLDAGKRVALRSDGDHIPADTGPGHRARLLAYLALVQPGEARKPEAA